MKKDLRRVFVSIVAAAALMTGPSAFAGHDGELDLENGKAAYATTCVACHGKDGRGVMSGIPDFTDRSSPFAKTDDELFTSIADGFQSPGSFMAMPERGANPDLSDRDILDLIYYMRETF